MKRMLLPALLVFCAFAASLLALPQEHPMINPAALELQKMGYHTTSFCRIDSWKKAGYRVTKERVKPSSR